ncbi:MAG: hypothetical protein ACYS0I_22305 [Planctomycetota bacterium]|jgi:hypothetical protein
MPDGMSQEQMVERIFADIDDARAGRQRLHEKLDLVTGNMVTKNECHTIRKNAGDRKDKVLMRLKDVILLAAAIAGFLWGSGIFSR